MVCLHGFTDTWRTWELVLPALEQRHDVLALTLPGHAGGPPADEPVEQARILDRLEGAMDDAGMDDAHLVGNSLGGYLALRLAERGRARSVVALAPAGGWDGGGGVGGAPAHFTAMRDAMAAAAPHAEAIVATPEGRRNATRAITCRHAHIPADLLAHQMRGVAGCTALDAMLAGAIREGWLLDAARIACPVRVVWGAEDRLLPWPAAAARMRRDWLPHADWVVLDGVGHCPQLDVPLETAQLILGVAAG